MGEIPDWIEQGMFVRSAENEGMFYEVDDIAESEIDSSEFIVLSKIDNSYVKETMYDWEFDNRGLVEVQAAECPLCGERGEIKHSNLNTCYNNDCDVAEYRGESVDVDSSYHNVCEEETEELDEDFEFKRGDYVTYEGRIQLIDERIYRVDNVGDSGWYYKLKTEGYDHYVDKSVGEEKFELILETLDDNQGDKDESNT